MSLEGIDELRNIVKWADLQYESHFEGKSVRQIINIYKRCRKAGVDCIEDIAEGEESILSKKIARGVELEKEKKWLMK